MIAKRMMTLWKTCSSYQIGSDHSENRLLAFQEFSDRESSNFILHLFPKKKLQLLSIKFLVSVFFPD